MKEEDNPDNILFVSTFPPRECGIATFTKDLTDSIEKRFLPKIRPKILAINNNGTNIYNYPKKVLFEISDSDINHYIEKAKEINSLESIKLVCVQHEFGIFGGDYGNHILSFLKNLKKPVIITFHSVLPNPENELKKTVQSIAKKVKKIIVMTPKGKEILKKDYKIKTPINIIPHGIPDTTFEPQYKYKKALHLQNKIVLSTFGMLSSGKGYEYVIESLPKVIKKFPNLMFLIVGETHPVIRKKEGEAYRNKLESKVKKLNLQNNVKFYNKYVTIQEIIKYLKASDIYISSSLNPDQITSGTLAYAMGVGRAVISTPFLHAKDVINQDTGSLVKFKNSISFKNSILNLLENQEKIKSIEQHAYQITRKYTWQNTGIAYLKIFNKYLNLSEIHFNNIPKLNLSHIKKMTTNFGMIQFSRFAKPDLSSGYTLDDNARALLVANILYEKYHRKTYLKLIKTYLDYIQYVQHHSGKLFNYVDKNKKINLKDWSSEAHGRAIRALGFTASLRSLPAELKTQARSLFLKALKIIPDIDSPRAFASIITGISHYNKSHYSQENIKLIKKLTNKLSKLYTKSSHKGWNWYEPIITYSNAKLPEAFMHAYISTQDTKYKRIAKESLDFLIDKTFQKNIFVPIGQAGWHIKNSTRALFDQQPVEAASMTNALVLAFKIFKENKYQKLAISCFNWFLGKNLTSTAVYNEHTGGCHDALTPSSVNVNQGAESTIAFLLARIALIDLE